MAIQLIINKELGLAKNENPLQGSFIIEELTDLVEEAVYAEFDRITERGGVLEQWKRCINVQNSGRIDALRMVENILENINCRREYFPWKRWFANSFTRQL